jgi:mannose-6-phosphate isomerase-like protein (cupin superfamily)
MDTTSTFKVLQPGEGERILLGGFGVDFKLSSQDTQGLVSVVEHPFAPRTMVPPHMHTREDEYSIVIEGHVGFRSGDREVVLEPGGYITKPRGELHTMWNPDDTPSRIIEIITPAGFEHFFGEIAQLFASRNGRPGPGEIAELGATYGLSYNIDWVPELVERYGLEPMA